MKLKYVGKTKDIYELDSHRYLLKFKDDVTGENGVFDPGANKIGLTIDGAGKAALRLTKYFYEKLNKLGIPTHYLAADIDTGTMTVKKAVPFGHGLEVICRYRAVGSFLRRYGLYVSEGQPLDALIEMTLKDDARNDPLITADALEMLGILSKQQHRFLKELTRQIAGIVKSELASKGMELYDIKFEFGKVGEEGQIVLIDEISGGNMRVYQNGKKVSPLELEKLILYPSVER